MSAPENISPIFLEAVRSLGSPQGLSIYSDVSGTLLREGLNKPLYLGLVWAKSEGAEIHVISGGEPGHIADSLRAAGADMETLGPIESKMLAVSTGFAQKTIFVDDDEGMRKAVKRRLQALCLPFAVLDPEKL